MMPISIEVITYKGKPVSTPIEADIASGEISIGRRETNRLVLPDNEKFVSAHHATISGDGNDYYVTDYSSNGLYVNQSSQPVGKNNRVRLNNGDQLSMGEYEMKVSISATKSRPLPEPLPDSPGFDDPFADFDSGAINKIIEENQSDVPDPDDPFADFQQSPAKPGSASDHLSPLNEALNARDGQQVSQPQPEKESVVETRPDTVEGIPEDWMEDDSAAARAKQVSGTVSETPTENVPDEPATVQMKVSQFQQAREQPAVADTELIQQFLKGTGLPHEDLGLDLSAETFAVIGKLLRLVIQGLMDVMIARSEIKNELRLDVTTLRSVENNPIKFSLNADEALVRLLTPNKPGYMSSEDAVAEAFDDLRAHQIAVLSGMQKSLHDVLLLFNPEKLEKRLQKHNPVSASIPIQKRAKLWDLFEELYEEIEKEASDNFNELFGSSFAEAYEKQSRQLKTRKDPYPGD